MPSSYVPERGDVVWIRYIPQAGHEQSGRRPAVVLSQAAYNGKVGLALLCPVTSQVKAPLSRNENDLFAELRCNETEQSLFLIFPRLRRLPQILFNLHISIITKYNTMR